MAKLVPDCTNEIGDIDLSSKEFDHIKEGSIDSPLSVDSETVRNIMEDDKETVAAMLELTENLPSPQVQLTKLLQERKEERAHYRLLKMVQVDQEYKYTVSCRLGRIVEIGSGSTEQLARNTAALGVLIRLRVSEQEQWDRNILPFRPIE